MIAGCGGANTTPTAAEAPSAAPAAIEALAAATDLDGQLIGNPQRTTVVVVFASWCGPCRRELAMLGALRREVPEVRFVGVNAYEEYEDRSDEARLRAYLAANAPWLQVVRGDARLLAALGSPQHVPTVLVYDAAGALRIASAPDEPPLDRQTLRRSLQGLE